MNPKDPISPKVHLVHQSQVATGANAVEAREVVPDDANLVGTNREINKVPGYLTADPCLDLIEYGSRLKLASGTSENQKVILETQLSADKKFAAYLDDIEGAQLLPGDPFLRELHQANLTELERFKEPITELFSARPVLPLFEYSKLDAAAELSLSQEQEYERILNASFKDKISTYLSFSKARTHRDAISRIRRVLREKARAIRDDRVPRSLESRLINTAEDRKLIARRSALALAAAGTLALIANMFSTGHAKRQGLDEGSQIKETVELLDPEKYFMAKKLDWIEGNFNNESFKFYMEIVEAAREQVLEKEGIDILSPNEETYFSLGNSPQNYIGYMKNSKNKAALFVHSGVIGICFREFYKNHEYNSDGMREFVKKAINLNTKVEAKD